MTMSSRIAVMNEGYFLQVGTPDEIYETPNSRLVAGFIGNVNVFEGEVVEDEVDHVTVQCPECLHYVGHGITGTPGMAVGVALRPEKIQLSREQPDKPYNWCSGKVVELAYFGAHTTYHLKLDTGMMLKVQLPNLSRHNSQDLTWDDHVFAHWSEDAMVVLTQ